jgi:hypothetical protein
LSLTDGALADNDDGIGFTGIGGGRFGGHFGGMGKPAGQSALAASRIGRNLDILTPDA